MNRTIATAFICAFCAAGLNAQTFDVASIKPTDPASHGGRFLASDGRFEVHLAAVKDLIGWAYNVRSFQIVGGPAWLQTPDRTSDERFDILAKGDASAGPETIRLMVQSLLSDRFQLKLHRETKEISEYALVVGKAAPKLEEAKSGDEHSLRMFPDGLVGHGASMALLAGKLTNDRPVIDKTGLTGSYDFSLKWKDDDPNSPSLFTAIQEQLGLKLEPTKGAVEVLIVDSCSKQPSGN